MVTREIQFSPLYTHSNSTLVLMELPDSILSSLREHHEVLLKGQPNDDAILCTDTESYLIRSHETSNDLLILDGDFISARTRNVYITETCVPPVHQTRGLLAQSPFTWKEVAPYPVYTLSDLMRLVQASRAEIETELRAIHAFEWKGYIRVMDDQERIETIKHVLCHMMQTHTGVIAISSVLSHVPGLERVPLEACLSSAGLVHDGQWTPDSLQLYRMCAIDLFLSKSTYFQEEFKLAFLSLSEMLIPAKLVLRDLSIDAILAGIAVKKTDKGRNIYRYFPMEILVKDFAGRMEQMFEVKEKWSQEELRAYVGDIEEKELQQLLIKYTRRLVEEGVPQYMKKA